MMEYHPTVKKSWDKNFEIWRNNPKAYFAQISAACYTQKFFRWHVGGDIVNDDYLEEMVNIAKIHTGCQFLAFTKKYDLINGYLNNHREGFPKNLKIILSRWGDWPLPNPYRLPESTVIFKDTEVKDDWKICGGNCTECACRGIGCWELKDGETIAFYEH